MSYVSVLDFLKSGITSLKHRNYYSALSVALSLPSMCSRIEYKDNVEYCRRDKDGKLRWLDKKSYVDFCNTYVVKCSGMREWFDENIGDILYNLRCDIVHAGCADIYDGDYAIWLSWGPYVACTQFSKYKIVNIEAICESIFNQIGLWISGHGVYCCRDTRVFCNTHDDVLLYNSLCNKDRAELLCTEFMGEFIKRKNDKK